MFFILMIDKKIVERILKEYGEAWVNQDTQKILSIFLKDGTYQERIFDKPMRGHEQIKKYWQNRVIKEQSDIKFRILNCYVDGNTIIAEWEASFYIEKRQERIHMKEVAIIEVSGDKIKSLREYWQAEIFPKND